MPARKSARRKALAGEKRPCRLLDQGETPERPGQPPEPPADLAGQALAIWHELAPAVWRAGYLVPTDHTAFGVLCGILATERAARAELERDGLTCRCAAGTLKAHPALRAAETARAQARGYLESFGLTPAGRQRIDAAPPATLNAFSEFGS